MSEKCEHGWTSASDCSICSPAAQEAVRRETDRLRKALERLGGYALTCRRYNQREWMQGLAEALTELSATIGQNETYEYGGDFIVKSNRKREGKR